MRSTGWWRRETAASFRGLASGNNLSLAARIAERTRGTASAVLLR